MTAGVIQPRSLTISAGFIGLFCALAGAAVYVLGWLLGHAWVIQPIASAASVKPNAAGALFFAGTAVVWLAAGWPRWVAGAFGAVVAGIGALTVLEWQAFPSWSAFDQLLAIDPGDSATQSAGRMGLNTALAFTLIGLGLILLSLDKAPSLRAALGGAGGLVAFVLLLGYVMGAPTAASSFSKFTQTALQLAAMLCALGVAVVILDVRSGWAAILVSRNAGGRIIRVLVPTVVGSLATVALAVRLMSSLGAPETLITQMLLIVVTLGLFAVVVVICTRISNLDAEQARTSVFVGLLDAAPDPTIAVDDEGVILQANAQVSKVFGYTPADLIDQHVATLLPTEISDPAGSPRLAAAGSSLPREFGTGLESVARRSDGSTFPVEISLAPVDIGDITLVVASIRDITQRKRLAEELEEFAYVASHDLQAPLRTIGGFTELLDESFDKDSLSADQRESIEEIIDGVARMRALIRALLEYSTVSRGTAIGTQVSLDEVVSAALFNLARDIGLSAASVETNIDAGLLVRGEPTLLATAVQNAVANSLKYRHADRTPVVEIAASATGAGWAKLVITDNGRGMPPDQTDRAFKMFQRLTAVGTGMGIGLATSRKIVERFGGTVTANSDGATGTTITFTFRS